MTVRFVRPKPEDEPDASRYYIVLVGEPLTRNELLAELEEDEDEQQLDDD